MKKKRPLLLFFYLKIVVVSAVVVFFGVYHYLSIHAKTSDALKQLDVLGYTPLLRAIADGNIAMVKKMIAEGADVNGQSSDPYGMSALDLAVLNGNERNIVELVDILLRAGADPGLQDKQGFTPLHRLPNVPYPSEKDRVAYALLSHNAPINIQNFTNGNTPVHTNIQEQQLDSSVYLFKNFAPMMDLNIRNKSGYTALDLANINVVGPALADIYGYDYLDPVKQTQDLQAFSRKNRVVYEWQRFGRNNSNARDIFGRTGLMLAIMRDDYDFAQDQVLERGADVNAQANNKYGNRPLNFACMRMQDALPYVRLLLNNGANPRLTNKQGETPLHMIFSIKDVSERKNVAAALLEKGAYLLATDEKGNTPLHMAALHKDRTMMLFFKRQLGTWVKNNQELTAQQLMMVRDLKRLR